MPILDGFRLAEAMRRDDRTQSIPLIFLSGETDAASERQALDLGAFAYLTKPFDPPALTAVATGVIARFSGGRNDGSRVTPIRRGPRAETTVPSPPAA